MNRDIRSLAIAQRRARSAAHPVAKLLILLRDTGRDILHTSSLPQVSQGVPHTWPCTVAGRELHTPVTIVFVSPRDPGVDKLHTSALPQVRQGALHTWSCAVTSRERCTLVTSRFA
jgi:hypothetical protein